MFEQFIIGILWIIGPMVAFVLLLGILFAEGGVAQTNNIELHIVSKGSMLLLIALIWLGISSLIGEDDTPHKVTTAYATTVADTTSVQNAKAPSTYEPTSQVKLEIESTHEDIALQPKNPSDTSVQKVPTSENPKDSNPQYDETDYLLWSLYFLVFLIFMWWIFSPSKQQGQGRELVKEKFVSTIKFEADEQGRKPWHSDWKDPKTHN